MVLNFGSSTCSVIGHLNLDTAPTNKTTSSTDCWFPIQDRSSRQPFVLCNMCIPERSLVRASHHIWLPRAMSAVLLSLVHLMSLFNTLVAIPNLPGAAPALDFPMLTMALAQLCNRDILSVNLHLLDHGSYPGFSPHLKQDIAVPCQLFGRSKCIRTRDAGVHR